MDRLSVINKQERIQSLDWIRSFAILFVVINHISETLYSLDTNSFGKIYYEISTKAKLLSLSSFTLGRIGVPLFFFLTGYLLLSRDFDFIDYSGIKKFYKHNFLSLLIVWEIWILIYQFFICWTEKIPFDLFLYLRRALFLQSVGLPHTWYVSVILGIYLFLPFVSIIVHQLSEKLMLILLIILYFYLFLVPSFNVYLLASNSNYNVSNILDLNYIGGAYGFYVLMGFVLNKYSGEIKSIFNNKLYLFLITFVGLFSFGFTIYFQYKILSMNYIYTVWYDFFTIPIIGFCVYIFLSQLNINGKIKNVIQQISFYSFGIYLIHELIIKIIIKNEFNDLSIWLIILSFGVFMISFLIVKGLCHFKIFQYLFMVRKINF